MSELKPCPFCGGEAVYSEDAESGRTIVYCQKHVIGGCCVPQTNWEKTKEDAIRKWNTRADTDHLKTAMDALEKIENEDNWWESNRIAKEARTKIKESKND